MRKFVTSFLLLPLLALGACESGPLLGPDGTEEAQVRAARGGKPDKPGDGSGNGGYTLVDLGPGGLTDINDAGTAVGVTQSRAALWRSDETLVLLQDPGGTQSSAQAINAAGTIVVGEFWSGDVQHAVRWDVDAAGGTTAMTTLAPLAADNAALASDVNDAGQAVGQSYPSGDLGAQRAVLWDAAGMPRYLGDLPGRAGSWATAINNAGHAVGRSGLGTVPEAVLWIVGPTTTTIVSLGAGSDKSFAWDVTEPTGGVVEVAGMTVIDGSQRPTVWTVDTQTTTVLGVVRLEDRGLHARVLAGGQATIGDAVWGITDGTVVSLPRLSKKCSSNAGGINAHGTVVGSGGVFAQGSCGASHALIWRP